MWFDFLQPKTKGKIEPEMGPVHAGVLAYADGVVWNPGKGEGYYYYNSLGQWIFLPFYSVYGSMYMEDASVATPATLAHGYYPILSGFSGGLESGCLFQNAREIKIAVAGKYKVDWSLSISVDASDQTIEGLVLGGASGMTAYPHTVNATRAKENGVVYSVGGSGIIACVVNDLIRLGIENETSAGKIITTNHATLSVMRIGA